MNEQVKILCVDDEVNVLRALERQFMDDDIELLLATSGEEGLSILEESAPVQVVIADYRMPVMNGIDFLREAFHRWPDTIRIVLSGYADTATVVQAINDGHIDRFVAKPWKEEALHAVLREELQRFRKRTTAKRQAEELARKNRELNDINAFLERAVAERTAELHAKEEAARLSRDYYLKLFEEFPSLIWRAGTDAKCNYFNRTWLEFTGRALEEELGDGWAEGVHPDDFERCLTIYREAFDARQSFDMEYRLKHHDGTYHWIVDYGRPFYDLQGNFAGYIGTCYDENAHKLAEAEQKRMQKERQKLEAQLIQAQKMESVGTLAGGIAHDFNNILTVIIGSGNLLKMKMEDDNPLLRFVDHILESGERAAKLTQSLLAFSRKQTIDPRPLDVNVVVTNLHKFLERIIGEDIELLMELTDENLYVLADKAHLEQVLLNLASNARDAMPDGGVLSISTNAGTGSELGVTVPVPAASRYAVVSVADSGCGMNRATQTRIFEPFFSTKGIGKGTGLGLSMAYGIIKQHDGFINVYSEPEKGSTFRIYLPLILATPEEDREVPLPPATGCGTILLAEDDEEVRRVNRLMLEEFGYTVITANDGEDAVAKFRDHQGEIQLIILDVIMPVMNGKQAFEAIRAFCPDVKALFTSGYTADIIHRKGVLEEGLHFISKPLSPQRLLAKVREILNS